MALKFSARLAAPAGQRGHHPTGAGEHSTTQPPHKPPRTHCPDWAGPPGVPQRSGHCAGPPAMPADVLGLSEKGREGGGGTGRGTLLLLPLAASQGRAGDGEREGSCGGQGSCPPASSAGCRQGQPCPAGGPATPRERSRDPCRITVQTEVTRVPPLCWPGEIGIVSGC